MARANAIERWHQRAKFFTACGARLNAPGCICHSCLFIQKNSIKNRKTITVTQKQEQSDLVSSSFRKTPNIRNIFNTKERICNVYIHIRVYVYIYVYIYSLIIIFKYFLICPVNIIFIKSTSFYLVFLGLIIDNSILLIQQSSGWFVLISCKRFKNYCSYLII